MDSMRWFLDFQMEPAIILYSKEDGNVKTLSGCFDCFDYAIGKKIRRGSRNPPFKKT
jgi:hypothetical protein